MNHSVFLLEVVEGLESSYGHLAADGFRNRLLELLEELVEASGHQLHADPDVGVGDEAAEAEHDLETEAVVQPSPLSPNR